MSLETFRSDDDFFLQDISAWTFDELQPTEDALGPPELLRRLRDAGGGRRVTDGNLEISFKTWILTQPGNHGDFNFWGFTYLVGKH